MDRLAMRLLFERSVSPEVAETIWQGRDEIFDDGRLKPRKLLATVLFTDLEGFTRISELLDKQGLIDWLNEYFEKVSGLVRDCGGNINKFNGDQILAVFGPPLARTDIQATADTRGAMRCAVLMRVGLRELNEHWKRLNKPQVRMRIGVHTGEVVAGSLGSRERQEWTVIGDTVNVASRLESFDKTEMSDDIAAAGCRILISDTTFERLEVDKLHVRSLGLHPLSGRSQQIQVIGVIDYCNLAAVPPPSTIKSDPPSTVASAKGNNPLCNV
jgi:adenylate cyclase